LEASDLLLGLSDRNFRRLWPPWEGIANADCAGHATSTEHLHLWNLVLVALSGLGALTAFANFLSARGSKFWQQNWERHIDMLEDDIEGRLHKTVWLTMTPFSVSGINKMLSVFFVLFWVGITFYVAYALDFLPGIDALWRSMITIAVVALGIVSLACQTSDLPGSWPKDDGSHDKDKPFKLSSWWCNRRKEFIRRYAPGEDTPVA
jgi:hypothetical protein